MCTFFTCTLQKNRYFKIKCTKTGNHFFKVNPCCTIYLFNGQVFNLITSDQWTSRTEQGETKTRLLSFVYLSTSLKKTSNFKTNTLQTKQFFVTWDQRTSRLLGTRWNENELSYNVSISKKTKYLSRYSNFKTKTPQTEHCFCHIAFIQHGGRSLTHA